MKRILVILAAASLMPLAALADKTPLINSQGVTIPTELGSGVSTWWQTPSSANLRTVVSDESGTGALLFAGGAIGAATATTINGLTISSTSGGTLTINSGASLVVAGSKTATVSNTLTFTGTDGTSFAFPSSSGTVVTLDATQTLSGKTLTAPKFADLGFIADANGNELLIFDTVASSVNEVTYANAATGTSPIFSATGGDTNIGITLTPKGTGSVLVNALGSASAPALGLTGIGGFYGDGSNILYLSRVGETVAWFYGTGSARTMQIPERFAAGKYLNTGDGNDGIRLNVSSETTLVAANTEMLKVSGSAGVSFQKTITGGGTTGAQTINKTSGSVNFAATATSLVVTNSLVTTSSVIIATVATNDTTMKTVACVAASGSFTMHANAAATGETRVNFLITN